MSSQTGIIAHKISGIDAPDFLHNVMTANVQALEVDQAQASALLTPQGKILFAGLIYRQSQSEFILLHPEVSCADFIKRLTFYKLRADVNFEPLPVDVVFSPIGEVIPKSAMWTFTDPRHAQLGGWSGVQPHSALSQSVARYQEAKCSLGVLDVGLDVPSNSYFPHDLAYDLLNTVSFSKGCYIGQEVVSRMYHKGGVRKRPVLVSIAKAPSFDLPMKILDNDDKSVGEVLSRWQNCGVGVVRIDKITSQSQLSLENGACVSLDMPSFADYGIGC